MADPNEGRMIVKANQIVQAKMPLTKLEHRVVGALISQLDRDDKEFDVQKLHVKDLLEETGSKDQSLYSRGEEICSSLLEKKLEIKMKEDGQRVYDGISLMSRCKYKEGDGYIEAKFNEEMKPYLLQLKRRFTMYNAGYFLPLGSTYSMRVYELLKMREGVSILRLSVKEFRETLGVENSYSSFSQLKYHVINKAQEEIAEKTDITFTYDVEREGRSAKRLKFFIRSNGQDPQPEKPKMEDRTSAPNIDVINLFLNDLSQEELDQLDDEKVDALHQKALEQAKSQNPDAQKALLQSETYRIMKRLWEN